MNNQTFIIAGIVLCSLCGWYVVVAKYLEIKKMVNDRNGGAPPHIPGMGPPPVANTAFTIPEDLLMGMQYSEDKQQSSAPAPVAQQKTPNLERRLICNWASILHLSGFAVITGIPFLNVLAPTILWLLKKEQHVYIAKHGREVINFQITFTIIQFLCLGGGVIFIRFMPAVAEKLFAFTKLAHIVFSSGMYLPFNIFTVIPFFWGCIVMIRGTVAAYHGLNYKYPGTQPFIFEPPTPAASPAQPPPPKAPVPVKKMSFG